MKTILRLSVNGKQREDAVADNTLPIDYLREALGLTGTKQGCDGGESLKLPGVRAIVTGADCDVPYGLIPIAQNEFPLARERIRYIGEPVAAVAAVDEAAADLAWSPTRRSLPTSPSAAT